MPESRRRTSKKNASKRKRSGHRGPTPPRSSGLPPVDRLVRTILSGADELLDVQNPLGAEMWASAMLGLSYKQPLPIDVRERFPEVLWSGVVAEAERRADQAETTGRRGKELSRARPGTRRQRVRGPSAPRRRNKDGDGEVVRLGRPRS